VPVLELVEQPGLSELLSEHVDLPSTRVAAGAVNPTGKPTSVIAAMACGADSADDADVLCASDTPAPHPKRANQPRPSQPTRN